jgi:hypothetical protein
MRDAVRRTLAGLVSRSALLAVLYCLYLAAILRGDERPMPPSGEVRLGSGRVVNYTIHFDRNSLRDSLRVGDGLIALTSSGALLRFELPAVRLVRERSRFTGSRIRQRGRSPSKMVMNSRIGD